MLHIELHSAHGPSSSVASHFSDTQPCQPTNTVLDSLSREMENMIVEHQLRSDTPLRTLWDTIVGRKRDLAANVSAQLKLTTPSDIDADGEGRSTIEADTEHESVSQTKQQLPRAHSSRLPSPPMSLSPETRLIELAQTQVLNGRPINDSEPDGDREKDGANLPSPRPSPPPSDVRSRSVSPTKRDSRPRSATPRVDGM